MELSVCARCGRDNGTYGEQFRECEECGGLYCPQCMVTRTLCQNCELEKKTL